MTETKYRLPVVTQRPIAPPKTAYLVASGDLRADANRDGWTAQRELEEAIAGALGQFGWNVSRAHPFDEAAGHGFIDSQRMGIEVFSRIPSDAPIIVAESIWQYSHHVLPGLRSHRGPILTVANFSGEWPGLVGLLNLNASLTKMGRSYSTTWSVDFSDDWFVGCLGVWLETGTIVHDESHVRDLPALPPSAETELAIAIAAQFREGKAIIGIFDEGCMGMYNAILDDERINPLGIFKERLSQSALYAEILTVGDDEAESAYAWLDQHGMRFDLGTDEATQLTRNQVLQQLKMYIAALRIADDYALDAVGIQYQQGLKDLVPASDLAEGLLNNAIRPPVLSRDGTRTLWDGVAFPHFNEVDEGAGVDALITNRVWSAMGLDPATTLHDIRWGEQFGDDFVWVLMISGAVPPSHLIGGYAGSVSERQPARYFPLGGGTVKGISKPGEIVWSRIYDNAGVLHADLGRATVIELPLEETERRWASTTPQWPIMHAVLHGVSRNQMMSRHKANHVQVAYAPDAETADRALAAKATTFAELGIVVHLCGDVAI
ncbi:MAG: hypothetical protein QOH69_1207 [Actinomycetota bacterium]|jgi:hypothetical protein|nr:hypothetical protein [Actinomycetota bacterium]